MPPVEVRDQACQAAGEGALAAPRWPGNQDKLPRLRLEGRGVQAMPVLRVAVADSLSLQYCFMCILTNHEPILT